VLVTSRSYDEYVAMFDLDEAALPGLRVLDCCAGASSFVAGACRRGAAAVAVDPLYRLPREEIAETSRSGLAGGNAIWAQHPDRFTWSWYGDPQARDRMRARALAEFVLDLSTHSDRYVGASLPTLPYDDRAFDLALCSHLLFTWADQLGREWHRAALLELARVAAEVRVFPTVLQGPGEPVPFWDALMADLRDAGLVAELRRSPYEFQVGADHMLVVRRAA
jgi:hypothetical protein